MIEPVTLGKSGPKAPCRAMVKQPETSFTLRIGGMPLPGLPITSKEDFSDHVTERYLGNPNFKVTGKMPGEKTKPVALKKKGDLDAVLNAGGEINLFMIHFPLTGKLSED